MASCSVQITFEEAVEGSEAEKWQKAINVELEAHRRNGTWVIIPQNPGMRTIDSKRVFKVNQTTENEEPRFKARLYARGFQQKKDEDYTETFSPVVR